MLIWTAVQPKPLPTLMPATRRRAIRLTIRLVMVLLPAMAMKPDPATRQSTKPMTVLLGTPGTTPKPTRPRAVLKQVLPMVVMARQVSRKKMIRPTVQMARKRNQTAAKPVARTPVVVIPVTVTPVRRARRMRPMTPRLRAQTAMHLDRAMMLPKTTPPRQIPQKIRMMRPVQMIAPVSQAVLKQRKIPPRARPIPVIRKTGAIPVPTPIPTQVRKTDQVTKQRIPVVQQVVIPPML